MGLWKAVYQKNIQVLSRCLYFKKKWICSYWFRHCIAKTWDALWICFFYWIQKWRKSVFQIKIAPWFCKVFHLPFLLLIIWLIYRHIFSCIVVFITKNLLLYLFLSNGFRKDNFSSKWSNYTIRVEQRYRLYICR